MLDHTPPPPPQQLMARSSRSALLYALSLGRARCLSLHLAVSLSLIGCGAPPHPTSAPNTSPSNPSPLTFKGASDLLSSGEELACLTSTQARFRALRASIDELLKEVEPLLVYLNAMESPHMGQRMHRAHYIAQIHEAVFERLREMERARDLCEPSQLYLERYRLDLAQRLTELMSPSMSP